MSDYKAPLRDIHFVMHELFNFSEHYQALPGFEEVDSDLVDTVLREYAHFCENVVAPLNRSGDEEGCSFHNGEVNTPSGFKVAYKKYVQAGWTSLPWQREYGGQGLPLSLNKALGEILNAANMGLSLYTSAQPGAIATITEFGTEKQRELYASKLIDGTWNATMCLTESHSGSDLGLLLTRAEPRADGTYRLTGTKIFITGGEHDLNENIIHLVLARLPEAPPGTRGISLFIVPKVQVSEDGLLGGRNQVQCGSLEHKMGVKASATCVMHFEGATGYLLGEENRGLHAMFTFINASRVSAAIQGVAHAELGFQKSLSYSLERLQMRSLSGPKNPTEIADPIIVHPDIRRMLLTQKAFAEGNRMLTLYLSKQLDLANQSRDESVRIQAKSRLELLTPIAKAFVTETGFESANLALQCFGGHGYIREWGVEQNVRDARIATLYEGTTGIQALDLLNRKILGSDGDMLFKLLLEIERYCDQLTDTPEVASLISRLKVLLGEWRDITEVLRNRAERNPEIIGAASVNYLMYSGYICLAYFWIQAAEKASHMISENPSDRKFYEAKLTTAIFYYDHILPRTRTCVDIMDTDVDSLMALDGQDFVF